MTLSLFRELASRSGMYPSGGRVQTGIACPACRAIDRFRVFVDLDSGLLVLRCACDSGAGMGILIAEEPRTLPEGT